MKTPRLPFAKIVLIVWLVFTSLYLVYGEYSRLTNFVAQGAYSQGYRDSVAQLLTEVAKCQPVPINFEGKNVQVIGIDCLQKAAEAQAAADGGQTTVPVGT